MSHIICGERIKSFQEARNLITKLTGERYVDHVEAFSTIVAVPIDDNGTFCNATLSCVVPAFYNNENSQELLGAYIGIHLTDPHTAAPLHPHTETGRDYISNLNILSLCRIRDFVHNQGWKTADILIVG